MRDEAASERTLAPGQRLGEWILEEPLGRGAYAEVWRARHNTLPGRRAALKVPHDPAYAALLRGEGLLQHRLSGEHLVGVQGLDPEHDPPYLVVDLVEGGTLRRRIAAGPVPPAEALRLVDGIARGLRAAHAQGVIHRDLKPENVLLEPDGTPRVADFGLGLRRTPDELLSASLRTQRAQEVAGTLRYMAPEQRDPDEAVDARADLYALGVVLFELLTGEAPCGGELPSDVVPGLDSRLDGLYRRLCARLPARVASADALLEELAGLLAAPPAAAPDPAEALAARCVDVPAGVAWRAVALALDALPFVVLAFGPIRLARGPALAAPLLLAFILYDVVAVAVTGRTLGKRLCGLRVADLRGARPDVAQAVQREALRLVSLASLGLGYLPVLVGRAAFHDAFADTRVLHDATPR